MKLGVTSDVSLFVRHCSLIYFLYVCPNKDLGMGKVFVSLIEFVTVKLHLYIIIFFLYTSASTVAQKLLMGAFEIRNIFGIGISLALM